MKRLIRFLDRCWVLLARMVLMILTHLLYRPKIYYFSPTSPRRRLHTPTVITCNHLRGCDGAVISVLYWRERIHSLAARRWYRKWYLRPLLHAGYSIPIERSSAAWLRRSKQVLEEGESVLIFPEGMAVPGDEMRPFRPGFVRIAGSTGAQVLPMYMEGCYNRPFLKCLRVVVGVPYMPTPPDEEGATQEYYREQCDVLFQKTVELRDYLHAKRTRKNRKRKKTNP